ncbi:MAG: pyruvate:ferredoxin (flavodoxin) oxidoreductase [Eubacteriaceae bacterium]|nr:pyruvate:ferredoxin (flavodoxin) oxidoreductase [Eubacteriaceae bacterium]
MTKKLMKTMDGNTAAAYASYAFTDVAAIYPITPSSPMAEVVDEMAAHGAKNIFGQEVKVVEMQSEAGASGTVHGSLAAGALTTTYTASQGLLLMIPNMYKIAGEFLPCVFHVTARTLATHALCIFGDHSDVMATRQTGFAMLCSSSVQEVMDLGGISHLATIKTKIPFLHFFDGFRTSHEIQKIEMIDYKDFAKLADKKAIKEFRDNALNPDHPVIRGTAQNPDIFFQARQAGAYRQDCVPETVQDYMDEMAKITGRQYKLFDYVGAKDAENIIVAMGSVCETIEETVNELNAKGKKLGLVKVRLYRPWSPKHIKKVIPKTVKKIAVLDRTMEPGTMGDPLYMDMMAMYSETKNAPEIYAGRYGLGSKDTTPGQIYAVYKNLAKDKPKNHFTIGIVDDLHNTSLKTAKITTEPKGTVRCKFWGLGSDGTVGANKQAIKIIGDHTDMYAQGYFHYDSKKSGGITVSHLRFGENKIQSTYLITEADFVACHNQAYTRQYDVLDGLKKGGTFLLNCNWTPENIDKHLPANMKRYIAEKKIKFYIIDGTAIGEEIGLGSRINMIMQSAFFNLSKVIPEEDAVKYLKDSIKETYGKKGESIVNMNCDAVDKGISGAVKIDYPASWKDAKDEKSKKKKLPKFIEEVVIPMNNQKGDDLPVSIFKGREDGTFPPGTAAYEKRGVAIHIPEWEPEACIQCNQCAFICPHSAIRPILLTAEEKAAAPEAFETIQAKGKGLEDFQYRMQIDPMDCLGCGNCTDICPKKGEALVMKSFADEWDEEKNWDYAMDLPIRDEYMDKNTVKGSQFAKPYFEFSGACAGCGETPYIKVITQLFGDRMMIANATGCSSIWGASAPSMPYCMDDKGRGPSWANSLFEDNAEYGLGMAVGVRQMREKIQDTMLELNDITDNADVKNACQNWLDNMDNGDDTRDRADAVVAAIKGAGLKGKENSLAREIISKQDFLAKKSVWALGGDGWAYDIGYGGVDHVLASGEDVNILVFDTEVYSNTGGQASKATPTAAIAKFAASGKKTKKKDLGMMAMSYGYVYVAQVGMGADKAQFMKAVVEAEKHKGPSIIMCYSPCINHGIRKGMGKAQENIKDAVDCGYWQLYRYDPERETAGENPFILDSKEPKGGFRDFIMGQVRYASLKKEFPDQAEELFEKTEADAMEKYEKYKKMAESK